MISETGVAQAVFI